MSSRLFSLTQAMDEGYKIEFARHENSNVIGQIITPEKQCIPIFRIDNLPVIIPEYSGFNSLENALAFPAKTHSYHAWF